MQKRNPIKLFNIESPNFDPYISILDIAEVGAFIVSCLTTISLVVIGISKVLTILSAFVTIIMPIEILFSNKVIKDRYSSFQRYTSILYMGVISPLIWYLTGSKEIETIWMIFTLAFTTTALRKNKRIYFIGIELLYYLSIFYIESRGLVIPYIKATDSQIHLFFITSALETSFYIIFVLSLQSRLAENVIHKMAETQEETMILTEELTAQNNEIKDINKKLTETTEQLNESLEKQRMFSASMHHELRNPLNGVMGITQMMIHDESLNEDQRKLLIIANNSANALLGIVNDLLDYAKVEAGKFEIVKGECNLIPIKERVYNTFKMPASEKGLKYDVIIEEGSPVYLNADSNRICQILINFVSNSVKYTKKGYVKAVIGVRDHKLLRIRVADSGEGISEDTRKVLFIPYTRLNEDKHGLIQGTGLGLYIVKSIVTAMNGTIDIQSQPGKGSIFTVEIPVEVINNISEENHSSIEEKVPDFSNLKILNVDDSQVNLIIFNGLLKNTNAKIDGALSGSEALKLIQEKTYDLIFVDHLMPEMDGIELYKRIRALGINTPIFILTANADKSYDELYKETGFESKIDKPIQTPLLFSTIKKYVRSSNPAGLRN